MMVVTTPSGSAKDRRTPTAPQPIVHVETLTVYRAAGSGRRRARRFDAYLDFAKRALNAKEPWDVCQACAAKGTCNCSGVCAWCTCTCEQERARRWRIVRRYARALMFRDRKRPATAEAGR